MSSGSKDPMDLDLLDLYTRASAWALTKVRGAASQLDAPTTCGSWDVRTLMNHMLLIQSAFVGHARGEAFTLSLEEDPPDVLSDDPYADFEQARAEALRIFGEPGVIERTGTNLGNIFGDQLLHGWDLAVSTGQDATMPQGLPEAAYTLIDGAFTEEGRKGVLKPEITVAADAPAQDRLLAYSGRDPSRGA
jgi:uncharacterized protein (TIGR03086 family)